MKPVLLVRANGNERDASALKKLGIDSFIDPYIKISKGKIEEALKLLNALETKNAWVIATSRNSVIYWVKLLSDEKIANAINTNNSLRFAAVGEGTSAELQMLGATNIIEGSMKNSEGLLKEISNFGPATAIIPMGNLASRNIPDGLAKLNWQVITGVVYINEEVESTPKSLTSLQNGDFSAVLLRSPSAARALHNFCSNPKVPIFCGGLLTANEVTKLGMSLAAVTEDPTPDGVASMISEFFKMNNDQK